MDKNEFIKQVKQIYPSVNDSFFEAIETYKSFLYEYNQHTNLTRLDSADLIYQNYFYDSIIPYQDLDWTTINDVLDVGSGSGIPGVVLKLLFPHINLTIIEANKKKCIFLTKLVNLLNINVVILNKRAEEIEQKHREVFDLVTSRAVAPLPILLEISAPYSKVKGIIIEPKGNNYQEEYKYTDKLAAKLGLRLLPIKKTSNGVIIIGVKNKQTPNIYPRRYKDIVKEYERG